MNKDEVMNKNKTNETFVIQDLETLKVIADQLRSQLLELLIQETLTVKQLAEKLGLAPSKLYYHVNQLENYDLVEVVETRVVANMIEKLYRATASNFDVDPELLRFSTPEGKENINAVLVSTIDATREDLMRSLEARAFELEQGGQEQPRRAIINRVLSRLSEEQANQFTARFCELVEEFTQADGEAHGPDDELHTYALMIALYPSFYYAETPDAESKE